MCWAAKIEKFQHVSSCVRLRIINAHEIVNKETKGRMDVARTRINDP